MKIHVDKRKWRFAFANGILVVLLLICVILFGIVSAQLDSIRAAERWRGDNPMRFAQIACFLPVDEPKEEAEILQFRRTLDQKLLDASLSDENGSSLYADAYSGQCKLTVSGDHGRAEVNAIGVGGDFFLFHPLTLHRGSYISGNDLMQDRVVLDEVLAWQLFGGSDVAGMTVYIQGIPFYVAGVIDRESDFLSREAYESEPLMFLSYSAFHSITEKGITCYEIVMPDMISGFAVSVVSENFEIGQGDLVENSNRYAFKSLLQVIADFDHRSMRNNGVIYPYWENAVRFSEDYLALLVVLMALFMALPAAVAVVWTVRTGVQLWHKTVEWAMKRTEEATERKREARYYQLGEK